ARLRSGRNHQTTPAPCPIENSVVPTRRDAGPHADQMPLNKSASRPNMALPLPSVCARCWNGAEKPPSWCPPATARPLFWQKYVEQPASRPPERLRKMEIIVKPAAKPNQWLCPFELPALNG